MYYFVAFCTTTRKQHSIQGKRYVGTDTLNRKNISLFITKNIDLKGKIT